ncbi:MAG: hypothetical protein JSS01_17540, partial [Proteobacteria bacterium]|nr:hypothetical protein [Pseudomonadota bacterium]
MARQPGLTLADRQDFDATLAQLAQNAQQFRIAADHNPVPAGMVGRGICRGPAKNV